MTELEKTQYIVRYTLEQVEFKPKGTRKYMSQSEALRLLKPVKIGRARLDRLIKTRQVRLRDKENYQVRNSSLRLFAEDIYRLLND